MGQRNLGIGDLGMPFLFPLKGREELVIELAKRGSNFGQREISITGKGGFPAL